jgi:2-polyprenyl-6-methoxyphenol hydroxylase-like FAD-dependent oxidoreductase
MTKVAIVGASLGGLSAANVLHRLGFAVTVFELFRDSFEDRGGALGSVDVSLLHGIRGREGPPPRDITGHGHFYGSLWKYLYDGLPSNTVFFGAHVDKIEDCTTAPRITMMDGTTHGPYDFVVGADGGASVVRKYVTLELPVYAGDARHLRYTHSRTHAHSHAHTHATHTPTYRHTVIPPCRVYCLARPLPSRQCARPPSRQLHRRERPTLRDSGLPYD